MSNAPYLIVRKNNKLSIIDVFYTECFDFFHSGFREKSEHTITVTKNNRVYDRYSYEVLDDWFADTGAITHRETEREYLGILVYKSYDINDVVKKFFELSDFL